MKKLIILSLVLLLVSCSSGIEGMIYLKDSHQVSQLNTSNDVLKALPGNKHLVNFSEEENRISINYEVPLSQDMDKTSSYWEEKDVYKKIFIYNGGVLFSKNPDLNEIHFFLATKGYTYYVLVKREDVNSIFSDVSELNTDKKLSQFLKMVSGDDHIKEYYDLHAVLMFERDEDC